MFITRNCLAGVGDIYMETILSGKPKLREN